MDAALQSEKIWDSVTRCRVVFWQSRSFSTIEWHFCLGYTTGGLLLFRYFWGFLVLL